MRTIRGEEAERMRDEDLVGKDRPFLDLQRPDKDGKTTTYTIKFLQEPKEMKDYRGRKHIYGRVQLVREVGGYKPGKYTFDIVKVVLQQKLLPLQPLIGKTFAMTNLGKPFGKKAYNFDVKQL